MSEREPEPACLVLEGDNFAPVLHALNRKAPAWARVSALLAVAPGVDAAELQDLLSALGDRGLLETRQASVTTRSHQGSRQVQQGRSRRKRKRALTAVETKVTPTMQHEEPAARKL